MAESSTPRPPAQAAQPSHNVAPDGTPLRNAHPENDGSGQQAGASAGGLDEPAVEDLGARSFAGQNIAADRERQGRERGAGLGAGGSQNRDARHPAQGEGEVPEDDMD
jgi:hypothetical protein